MRLWLRLLVTLLVLAGIGLGAWCCLNRDELACCWASYRVGAAGTFEQAQAEIAWFETGPDHKIKLRELIRRWGTGDQQFDLYLALHVGHRDSSQTLRKAFSLGFGWHEERLPRWAHYWSWRMSQGSDEKITSILTYLDLLLAAESPKTITWREVLDLQAIFYLSGHPQLAKRLDPENWRNRYRQWRETHQGDLPHAPSPEKPFPDWQGPLPERIAEGF